MNIFGYYQPPPSVSLDQGYIKTTIEVECFLRENIAGLAKFHGLGEDDIVVGIRDLDEPTDVIIGTLDDPIVCVDGSICGEGVKLVAIFSLNRLTSIQHCGYPGMIFRLWMSIGWALRTWVIKEYKLSKRDLLPVSLLADNGYSEEMEFLMDGYLNRGWSVKALKTAADLAFIASYTADFVRDAASHNKRINMDALHRIIFCSRRRNAACYIKPRELIVV